MGVERRTFIKRLVFATAVSLGVVERAHAAPVVSDPKLNETNLFPTKDQISEGFKKRWRQFKKEQTTPEPTIEDRINEVKGSIQTSFPGVEVTLEGKNKEAEYQTLKDLELVLSKTGELVGNNLVSPRSSDQKLHILLNTEAKGLNGINKYFRRGVLIQSSYFDITPDNRYQLVLVPFEAQNEYFQEVRRVQVAHEVAHILQGFEYDQTSVTDESRSNFPAGYTAAVQKPMEDLGVVIHNPERVITAKPWEGIDFTLSEQAANIPAGDPVSESLLGRERNNLNEYDAELLRRFIFKDEFLNYFSTRQQESEICQQRIIAIKNYLQQSPVPYQDPN